MGVAQPRQKWISQKGKRENKTAAVCFYYKRLYVQTNTTNNNIVLSLTHTIYYIHYILYYIPTLYYSFLIWLIVLCARIWRVASFDRVRGVISTKYNSNAPQTGCTSTRFTAKLEWKKFVQIVLVEKTKEQSDGK